MGSKPWKAQLQRRLLTSAKYLAGEMFVIGTDGGPWIGRIECGEEPRGSEQRWRMIPVIFVEGKDEGIPIDSHMMIDGVSAKDWRE